MIPGVKLRHRSSSVQTRAESVLPGVPVGPRLPRRPIGPVPAGAIGVQPWGVLPTKPPRRASDAG